MKYYQSDTYKTFAFITVHTQNAKIVFIYVADSPISKFLCYDLFYTVNYLNSLNTLQNRITKIFVSNKGVLVLPGF